MAHSQLDNRGDGPEPMLGLNLEKRGEMIDLRLNLWGEARKDLTSRKGHGPSVCLVAKESLAATGT